MKIASIKITRNPVLGDLILDFTRSDSTDIADTIIFAGENGTGKTTILDIIFEFSKYNPNTKAQPEERWEFVVEFNQGEIDALKTSGRKRGVAEIPAGNRFVFKYDFSKKRWDRITWNVLNSGADDKGGNMLADVRHIFKTIYSPTGINFAPKKISSVTSQEMDVDKDASERAPADLATQIIQLLVDIDTQDARDANRFLESKKAGGLTESEIDQHQQNNRIGRFKSAYDNMFDDLKFSKVSAEHGEHEVFFERQGDDVRAKDLSSGEKQIVFRAGFLLKDKKSISGAPVLIDEPEISMHPKWQLKILQFYKDLFTNDESIQTSQVFCSTHSPFIIHNSLEEKVIVLEKGTGGTMTASNPSFFDYSSEEQIEKAFNVDLLNNLDKPVVLLVEGETDKKILTNAWRALEGGGEIPFSIQPAHSSSHIRVIFARELEKIMRKNPEKIYIGLFDFDKAYSDWERVGGYEGWNDVPGRDKSEGLLKKHESGSAFVMLLPVPAHREDYADVRFEDDSELEIELLFKDENLSPYTTTKTALGGGQILYCTKKAELAQACENFQKDDFDAFAPIFRNIKEIISDNE